MLTHPSVIPCRNGLCCHITSKIHSNKSLMDVSFDLRNYLNLSSAVFAKKRWFFQKSSWILSNFVNSHYLRMLLIYAQCWQILRCNDFKIAVPCCFNLNQVLLHIPDPVVSIQIKFCYTFPNICFPKPDVYIRCKRRWINTLNIHNQVLSRLWFALLLMLKLKYKCGVPRKKTNVSVYVLC